MKLVAPPLYVLTTQTLDKAKGVEVGNWGMLALWGVKSAATDMLALRGLMDVKAVAQHASPPPL
jgi:hypothetical protein